MAHARMPRRRLALAVTAALAVTVGTLTAVPAVAATGAVTAAEQTQQEAIVLPPGSVLVGNGPSGFLTRLVEGTQTNYRWTRYADGVTTTLPTGRYSGGWRSDHVVKVEGTVYTVYDMATGADPVEIDIAHLGTSAVFVRLAGNTVIARVPRTDGGTDVHLLGKPAGTLVDRKVTGLPANASIRRYEMSAPGTLSLLYYDMVDGVANARVALVDVATAAVVEDRALPTAAMSGDFSSSATHVAWAEKSSTDSSATLAVSRRGQNDVERIPLGTGATLNELMGDWVAYAVAGGTTAHAPNPLHALTARSLTDGRTVKLLDTVDSVRSDADDALLVQGGTVEHGQGLYRIAPGADGTPAATLVASTGLPIVLQLTGQTVPDTFDFRTSSGDGYLTWQFAAHTGAQTSVELTHTATGKRWTSTSSLETTGRGRAYWTGLFDDHTAAANGAYTWKMTTTPTNGIGAPVERTGTLTVDSGQAPHGFSDTGSPDLIVREGGFLFVYDGRQALQHGAQTELKETNIGAGWDAYDQIVTPGNVAGARFADLVARDKTGALWLHTGTGKTAFSERTKIGGGWQIYNKITAGGDLDGDARPDLVATDTVGDLWLYKGTGSATAPFAPRVKIGYGWGIYNKIVATGNIGGAAAGDLVARDTAGDLWLYLGNGDGTFAARTKIGGGWNTYDEIIAIGDADRDGRADLLAHGPDGRSDELALYSGTGDWKVPFAARSWLYAAPPLTGSYKDLF
ncbi:FG-GAP repeat domain-containing protein [Streptomyces exfoliatus]|uniref:FG-GAP repeat domain-containing protein n=1 Tax=Streptomyces exfoliatus TaxID=1905 RepID=UPI001FDF6781|nr:VCBS repeat-containing protein [Streptomyces exfoliatus]